MQVLAGSRAAASSVVRIRLLLREGQICSCALTIMPPCAGALRRIWGNSGVPLWCWDPLCPTTSVHNLMPAPGQVRALATAPQGTSICAPELRAETSTSCKGAQLCHSRLRFFKSLKPVPKAGHFPPCSRSAWLWSAPRLEGIPRSGSGESPSRASPQPLPSLARLCQP